MKKNKKAPWWVREDPDAQAEASKHEHPIPSRRFLLKYLDRYGRPIGLDKLTDRLELPDKRDVNALKRRLKAMLRDGELIRNRRGDYCLTREIQLVTGTIQGHKDGFGFLLPDEEGPDVFLSPHQMRGVMHGDRVAVRISGYDDRGRPEGSIVEVLDRCTRELVGRYLHEAGLGFVGPDNPRVSHRIVIPPDKAGKAVSGDYVVARITQQPTVHTQPIGRISRVLGDENTPGVEIDMAISAYDLPHRWPKAALSEAKAFGDSVPESAKRDRVDLRDLPLVTIDGADARDFDDAVYCEETQNGWRLYVAIADVAHYVRPELELDEEAEKRGTSVYFTRRVIPMLPEALSNGLCSLKPDVDRLSLVCEMLVRRDGKVTRSRFYDAVIRSSARLTYGEVAPALVDKDKKARNKLGPLLADIERLHALYRAFAKRRKRRGAIEFDMPQALLLLGENRRVERILSYERNDAHRIIEECMIAANVRAAKFLQRHHIATVYRVHAGPDEERYEALREFLESIGVKPPPPDPDPLHYANLMRRIADRPDVEMIETVMLRSLARAVYQPKNVGHFGLALSEYAHFTSPIRRYPDLLAHRGIKHVLDGRRAEQFCYNQNDMERLGRHCSSTERRADDATRDATDWLKCDYMRERIGKVFDAFITGVTGFGLFVQLTGLHIEGLVHVSTLRNDYYDFDATRHELRGRRSGTLYRLSDPIRVRCVNVDMNERNIDFEPVEEKRRR